MLRHVWRVYVSLDDCELFMFISYFSSGPEQCEISAEAQFDIHMESGHSVGEVIKPLSMEQQMPVCTEMC